MTIPMFAHAASELAAFLRAGGRWFLAGLLLTAANGFMAVAFFTQGPWFYFDGLVEYMHPGIDAPDNWATALMLSVNVLVAIQGISVLCFLVGCLRASGLRDSATGWLRWRTPVVLLALLGGAVQTLVLIARNGPCRCGLAGAHWLSRPHAEFHAIEIGMESALVVELMLVCGLSLWIGASLFGNWRSSRPVAG